MTDTTLSVGDSVDLTTVQLAEAIHAQLARIENFTGGHYPTARADIAARAATTVYKLHRCRKETVNGAYERVAMNVAENVCAVLFGELHPPAQFWMTPLGADIAWLIGYPHEEVPMWAATAVCALDRSTVFKAVRYGRLEITPAGLRAYVRGSARWMHWAKTLQPDASTLQPIAPSHSADLHKLTQRTAVQVG